MATAQGGKNTDLVVVYLALPTAPLTLYTDRVLAFLGKSTLVKQQAAIRAAAQLLIGFQGNLVQNRVMVPLRVSQHMLEAFLIGFNDRLFHAHHIFSLGLHQTIQVVAG